MDLPAIAVVRAVPAELEREADRWQAFLDATTTVLERMIRVAGTWPVGGLRWRCLDPEPNGAGLVQYELWMSHAPIRDDGRAALYLVHSRR
jgi:hypothetical protein